jgi:hypothetical protein
VNFSSVKSQGIQSVNCHLNDHESPYRFDQICLQIDIGAQLATLCKPSQLGTASSAEVYESSSVEKMEKNESGATRNCHQGSRAKLRWTYPVTALSRQRNEGKVLTNKELPEITYHLQNPSAEKIQVLLTSCWMVNPFKESFFSYWTSMSKRLEHEGSSKRLIGYSTIVQSANITLPCHTMAQRYHFDNTVDFQTWDAFKTETKGDKPKAGKLRTWLSRWLSRWHA